MISNELLFREDFYNATCCKYFLDVRVSRFGQFVQREDFFRSGGVAVCLEIFPDKWNEIIRRDFEAGGAYIISVTVTNLWGNFLTRKRFEDTQVFCKVST